MDNELGSYAPSMIHWTIQALECYKIGCNCRRCSVKVQLKSQKCQMKAVVMELIKETGLPDEDNCKKWSFKGYGRKRDISEQTRKRSNGVD